MNKQKIHKETGIPVSNMNFSKDISYSELEKLIHFNTKKHWHCFYDPKTKRLYNEYCALISENAKEYLVGIGLLSEDNKQLIHFEEE